MTIVIFGAPKPYSAQRRDRSLIRSRYGVFMNVAGSTGGELSVVGGMGGKLRAPPPSPHCLSPAGFRRGVWGSPQTPRLRGGRGRGGDPQTAPGKGGKG